MTNKNRRIRGKSGWGIGPVLMLLALAAGLPAQTQDIPAPDGKLLALDPAGPGERARLFAPGGVTSPFSEWGMTIAPGGDEIFYTLEIRDVSGQYKTFIAGMRWANGAWTRPEILSFSNTAADSQPVLSRDGLSLIFCSRRPLDAQDRSGDDNFWRVDRNAGSWGVPTPLEAVNSEADETMPFIDGNGDLYFCAALNGARSPQHIFVSKFVQGEFEKPEQLKGGVNTPGGEYNPTFSPDGRLLFLELVDAPGGLGGGDIYFSRKAADGTWGEPVNLGNVLNTRFSECRLLYSPGGSCVFFQSIRPPRLGGPNNSLTYNLLLWNSSVIAPESFDFYWMAASALERALK